MKQKGNCTLGLSGVLALIGLVLTPSSVIQPKDAEVPPSVNLSNIHAIYCTDNGMIYQGTGFLIAKNVLATANHVAEDQMCIDKTTGNHLTTYKTDKRHDFALMTEPVEAVGPYTRYSCQRPNPGQYYISYGWSSLGMPDFFTPILRNNNLLSTKRHSKTGDVSSFLDSSGMRIYSFPIAAGTSGGPVTDIFGNVIAINNAGNDEETLLFDLADTALCTGKWD